MQPYPTTDRSNSPSSPTVQLLIRLSAPRLHSPATAANASGHPQYSTPYAPPEQHRRQQASRAPSKNQCSANSQLPRHTQKRRASADRRSSTTFQPSMDPSTHSQSLQSPDGSSQWPPPPHRANRPSHAAAGPCPSR